MASEPSAVVWRPAEHPGQTLAEAAGGAGRADLVVLEPGVEPFGDWLDRLVAAAHSDTGIATASALLSEGEWAPEPLPASGLEDADATVAARSGRLRPRISRPHAGCVLLRRTALDAAAAAAPPGSTAAGVAATPRSTAAALADFGERCTALGLAHVLADDVLAAGRPALPSADETASLDDRYPHRLAAAELDRRPESPAEHAVLVASRGLDKLSVTIDGRAIGLSSDGTQVHAVELVAALGRTGRVALRVLTQLELDPQVRATLEAIDDLTLLPYVATGARLPPPTDIVHRPAQVFSPSDLTLLLPLGRRIVVTHQDLILYRIPSYHASPEDWQRYRRVTDATLAAADRVVFFSEHARDDAVADELVDPAAASVVPIGVDHHVLAGERHDAARPPALPDDGAPFLLCLGTDLPHKNHVFAVKLAAALRSGHGWDGRVVHAGAPARAGSQRDGDGGAIVRLGPVSEPEKAWLLERAAAVAYPTLYEGFGLVPFEAARAGTPCLFAAQSALAEVLPASTATLVAWDEQASAAAVAPLLREGPERSAHVDALRDAGRRYRWDATAQALVDLYEAVLVAPPRDLRHAARERLALEQRLAENEQLRHEEWQRHLAFRDEIGSDGLGLVGPGGVLDRGDQRALLALLSRGALRRPAMRGAQLAYRLALRLRRG